MKSLKQVINEVIPDLAVNQKNWIEYFKQHPELKNLLPEDINHQEILRSLNFLNQFIEEKNNCSKCSGLDKCNNLLSGHFTEVYYENNQLYSNLVKCNKLKLKEDEDNRKKLFKSMYIPNDILKASFKNIDKTAGRKNALKNLIEFVTNFNPNIKQKGIYLFGPLGTGKSHMIAAAANKLAEKRIAVLMVYVPDFFREIKSSIQDNSLEGKIDVLKNVQVLILDDIGAETISQWERDEILGAILQARMVKGLATLYTSNFTYDDLEEHLSYSNKGGEERLKAKRIMERIRHYTVPHFVDGPNRRI